MSAKKKRHIASSFQKQLLKFVDEYAAATEQDDVDLRDVARWAIETGRYVPTHNPVKQLARDMQAASRQEYVEDDNGELVRRRHSYKVRVGDVQHTLWSKMEKISRKHMHMSASGRRRSLLAGCIQLQRDLAYYNLRFNPGDPLQPSFNFEPDLEEHTLPTEYIDEMPPVEEEGENDDD